MGRMDPAASNGWHPQYSHIPCSNQLGFTHPPRPPAAPTTPVAEPTLLAGASNATSANTAPLPEPSAAATTRNAMVPYGINVGLIASTAAAAVTTAKTPIRTRIGPSRSDSQPPTGRIRTASSTNPAIRLAASNWVSP